MRTAIKELVDFVYAVTSRSLEVPRELYFLLDTFLDNHGVSRNYIVFVSDDMAVTAFEHILQINHMEYWFPKVYQKFKDTKFYFVHVVSDFVKREASLDWPLVLHEMAHIVCYEKNTYSKYFPKMSILECLQAVNEQTFPAKAQKKLYISEYLADLLTTKAVGALYGWRFLEMYGTYHDILDPGRSHPPPGRRILKMLYLVRDRLGVTKSAKFLKNELELRTEEWKSIPRKMPHDLKVDSDVSRIWKEADTYSLYALTYSQVTESLKEGPWFKLLKEKMKKNQKTRVNSVAFLKEAQQALLNGVPIIVEPFTLYYILTLDFSDIRPLRPILTPVTQDERKHALRIKELMADAIRLYSVEKEFLKLKTAYEKAVPQST
jgi:hypothetical protein